MKWGRCAGVQDLAAVKGRPRKGAWIEIATIASISYGAPSRPRKGAWIEISTPN